MMAPQTIRCVALCAPTVLQSKCCLHNLYIDKFVPDVHVIVCVPRERRPEPKRLGALHFEIVQHQSVLCNN